MRPIRLALAALATAMAPVVAEAVPVDVTYDLVIDLNIPAAGAFPAFTGLGTATLRFQNGTAGGQISPGPVHFRSGSARLSAMFSIHGDLFTGFLSALATGSGSGLATPSGGLALDTVGHIVSGFVHCQGATCFNFGYSPSVDEPLTSGSVAFFGRNAQLFAFPGPGPSSFTATGTAGTFAANTLTAQVTGQEVGRTVVPEPGTGSLVALGLLGLGLGSALKRPGRRGAR